LKEADGEQEQAKKLQVNATADRDQALQVLKDLMMKVRNNAKIVFEKNKNALNEFSSIFSARGGKKAAPPPTKTPEK